MRNQLLKRYWLKWFWKYLPGMWVTSKDGLDDSTMATNCFESLHGMATVWLKELTGQHNISSHFLPQLNKRSESERKINGLNDFGTIW